MGAAKLLDCTLRDGAYLVDKKFGDPCRMRDLETEKRFSKMPLMRKDLFQRTRKNVNFLC